MKAKVEPDNQKHKRYLIQDGGIKRLSESQKKAKKGVERLNMNLREGN